jgi:hypothetical protein
MINQINQLINLSRTLSSSTLSSKYPSLFNNKSILSCFILFIYIILYNPILFLFPCLLLILKKKKGKKEALIEDKILIRKGFSHFFFKKKDDLEMGV